MAFILAGDMGVQGAAAAPPPAVETRVAGASVATGAPFGGWRLLAQSTGTNTGTMGAPGGVSTPGSVSTPANGVGTPGNGSNGTIAPSGTNGINQGVPDYGPSNGAGAASTPSGSSPSTTTGTPAPSLQSAPGTSGAGLGSSGVGSPSLPTAPSSPTSLPSTPGSAPNAPSSTSVPSYGGSTTR
jgi:hypothetical protein